MSIPDDFGKKKDKSDELWKLFEGRGHAPTPPEVSGLREVSGVEEVKELAAESGKRTLELLSEASPRISEKLRSGKDGFFDKEKFPTPPEVEPVAYHDTFNNRLIWPGQISTNSEGRMKGLYYTSPPSPKAEWTDEDQTLPEDAEILAAHPLKTKRFDIYDTAQRLVGAKRSKFALIDLVNWAIWKAENRKAEWDAEGNPLNLEAAADDALDYLDMFSEAPPIEAQKAAGNLRKFLKDQS